MRSQHVDATCRTPPHPPVPEQYWDWPSDRYGVGWLDALLYKAHCAAPHTRHLTFPVRPSLPMRRVDLPSSWHQRALQPRPVYRCMQCRQDFDREERVRGHQSAPATHARPPAPQRRWAHSSTPGQRHTASAIDLRNAQFNMDVDVQHAYFGHNMHILDTTCIFV